MRFRRRSRRHNSNQEESAAPPGHNLSSSPFSNFFSRSFDFVMFPIRRRVNPFYIENNEDRNNIAPLYWQRSDENNYQTHVPKCLGIGMSYSEILQGGRPDNYSSDCWLQNCLDRFGLVQNMGHEEGEILHNMDEDDDVDDDSPVSSEVGSRYENQSLIVHVGDTDSFDNFSEIISDDMIDISGYTQIVVPPPYDDPETPPPSYEEAMGIAERRSNRSSLSGSSEIAFLW